MGQSFNIRRCHCHGCCYDRLYVISLRAVASLLVRWLGSSSVPVLAWRCPGTLMRRTEPGKNASRRPHLEAINGGVTRSELPERAEVEASATGVEHGSVIVQRNGIKHADRFPIRQIRVEQIQHAG